MKAARRARLFKISAVSLTLVVAALMAEVVLRWMPPERAWTHRPDPLLGWVSAEYQQADLSRAKPAGVIRVLFLGDSFLAGSGITDLDQRFPLLVEQLAGPSLEVAILAAMGWGTDQELCAYQDKGKSWDPDVVVLTFCALNDLANILSHHHEPGILKPYFVLAESGTLQRHNGRGAPEDLRMESVDASAGRARFTAPWWEKSFLLKCGVTKARHLLRTRRYDPADFPKVDPRYKQFRFWSENLPQLLDGRETLTWSPQTGVNHVSAFVHEDFPNDTYQWRLLDRLLQELHQEVTNTHARLVVMMLPAPFDPRNLDTLPGGTFERKFETPAGPFTFRSAEPRDRLARICARQGILFFDPVPEFREQVINHRVQNSVWPSPRDQHFAEPGHRILAGLTYAWLRPLLEELRRRRSPDAE